LTAIRMMYISIFTRPTNDGARLTIRSSTDSDYNTNGARACRVESEFSSKFNYSVCLRTRYVKGTRVLTIILFDDNSNDNVTRRKRVGVGRIQYCRTEREETRSFPKAGRLLFDRTRVSSSFSCVTNSACTGRRRCTLNWLDERDNIISEISNTRNVRPDSAVWIVVVVVCTRNALSIANTVLYYNKSMSEEVR